MYIPSTVKTSTLVENQLKNNKHCDIFCEKRARRCILKASKALLLSPQGIPSDFNMVLVEDSQNFLNTFTALFVYFKMIH